MFNLPPDVSPQQWAAVEAPVTSIAPTTGSPASGDPSWQSVIRRPGRRRRCCISIASPSQRLMQEWTTADLYHACHSYAAKLLRFRSSTPVVCEICMLYQHCRVFRRLTSLLFIIRYSSLQSFSVSVPFEGFRWRRSPAVPCLPLSCLSLSLRHRTGPGPTAASRPARLAREAAPR